MVRHTVFIILLTSIHFIVFGQEFTKIAESYIGGTKVDKPINFVKTPDNAVIVIGISNSIDGTMTGIAGTTSSNKVLLVKVSNNLELIWAKSFNYKSCSSVDKTPENGFCFIGLTASNVLEFVKVDESGNLISNYNLNINYPYESENILLKSAPDGSFYFGMNRQLYQYGTDWDVVFYKLSNTGQVVWNKRISGEEDEKIVDFFINSSGNVVLFGNTSSNSGDIKRKFLSVRNINSDIMMVQLDKNNGTIVKQKAIGGSQDEIIYSICKVSEEKYIFISLIGSTDGGIEIFNGNCCDNGIFAIDSNGNILWQKNTGSTIYSTITLDLDGKILVNSQGTYRKLTQEGSFLWSNIPSGFYPTSNTKVFTIPLENELYVSLGTKSHFVSPYLQDNYYLVKYKRVKPKIEITQMPQNVVCYNNRFSLSIDTVGVFASNNVFTVKAVYPYTGNTYTLYTGTATTFDLIAPTLGNYTLNQTTDFTLQVSSSNPAYSASTVNLRVQTPVIFNINSLSRTVNRGVVPEVSLGVGYMDGPHKFKVNNQIYASNDDYIGIGQIINKSSFTFNIQEYTNSCGTFPINKTHEYNIIDDTPNKVWDYTLGGERDDNLGGVAVTTDGGYVVAGTTASMGGDVTNFRGGQKDGLVIKFNEFGNSVWKRAYGGTNSDFIQQIKQTSDGGFIFVGFTGSSDVDLASANSDVYKHGWVTKLNSIGEIQWTQKYGVWRPNYGYYYQEFLNDIIEVDGGYVMVGSIDNYFGIRKIDLNGNELWVKLLGSDNGSNVANSIDKDAQGNLFVVGTGVNFQSGFRGGSTDIFFAKLSSNGTLLNSSYFGGNNGDYANKIRCTPDGGAILVGSSASTQGDIYTNYGLEDICILKISGNAALEWGQSYGSSSTDRAYDVIVQSDGYLVSGFFNNNDGNVSSSIGYLSTFRNQNLCVIKLSTYGRAWMKVLGGTGNTGFDKSGLGQFNNGNILVATNTNMCLGDIRQKKGDFDIWASILGSSLSCEENLTILQPISASEDFKRSNTISAAASILDNTVVNLQAGKNIELRPGFSTLNGVSFKAEIGSCVIEN
ncbi:hypothetical protein GCM10027035_23330 [Emticicia sediminis]